MQTVDNQWHIGRLALGELCRYKYNLKYAA